MPKKETRQEKRERERKKKREMKVSGKKVFKLKELIEKKSEKRRKGK